MGKTFVFFKCLQTLPKGTNVLFLAETKVRKNTVIDDAKFFKQVYSVDPFVGYNIKFALYQSAWKHDIQYYFPNSRSTFICCDEIHDLLTDKRILFILNSKLDNVKLLGLTATIDRKTKYLVQGEEVTKIELINRFCPVIYSYTINSAIEDKTTRELKFFVVKHELDTKRNLETGTKKQRWTTSEKLQYEYLDKEFKRCLFIPLSDPNRDFRIMMAASKRANFLYNLKSKTEECKKLVKHLKGKTLVFGQSNKELLEICPTAIVQDNPNLVRDLQDFKSGKTLLSCSNKILRQGENIPNLDNVVLHSYYSKWGPLTQMLGRLRQSSNLGYVIMFITSNTQEEKWFQSATENLKSEWIYCSSVDQLINRL